MFTNLILIFLGFFTWYFYNKYLIYEKYNHTINTKYNELVSENYQLNERIKELQAYRNDVSKTFQILDNELVLINDKINQQQNNNPDFHLNIPPTINNQVEESQDIQPNETDNHDTLQTSSISLLTPELLNNLLQQTHNISNHINHTLSNDDSLNYQNLIINNNNNPQ